MRTSALVPFGMAVDGIDIGALQRPKGDELVRLISVARVVVFRDQKIDDPGFVRFLRGLGELTFTAGETPVAGMPDLNIVSNMGRTTPPRSVFHTDTSYVEQPPAFTALRPVLLPRIGGATLFTDQVAVARGLPHPIRVRLAGRTVLHRSSGLRERSDATRHPLFRRHPVTGETALYLSTPERCSALSGVDAETSARVIAALYRRSIRNAGLYRHLWHAGDVLIWDDRTTMHRADHATVEGDRVLHRGMIGGEAPIPA